MTTVTLLFTTFALFAWLSVNRSLIRADDVDNEDTIPGISGTPGISTTTQDSNKHEANNGQASQVSYADEDYDGIPRPKRRVGRRGRRSVGGRGRVSRGRRSIADRILYFDQPWGEDPWSHSLGNPCR